MVTDTAFYRNPHYHRAEDTPDKLAYPQFAQVTEGLLRPFWKRLSNRIISNAQCTEASPNGSRLQRRQRWLDNLQSGHASGLSLRSGTVSAHRRWLLQNKPALFLELPGMKKPPGMAVFCCFLLERAKGFEPSTPTLARLCSTPELRPRPMSAGKRRTERARHHSERARLCKRRHRGEASPLSRACRSPSRPARASDWRRRNDRPDR